MPLLEHLRELRSRLFKACLGILVGCIVGYLLLHPAIAVLKAPYCEALHANGSLRHCSFTQLGVTEFFTLQIKLVLYMALLSSAPWWLYQLWAFVAPGLHRHERRWAYGFAAVATPLFLGGAFLAYLVVQRGLEFLLPSQGSGILTTLPIANYVNFVLGIMLTFGAAFEFPLILVLLNVAGLVSGRRLLRWWRISVFLMFLAAAVITPTPDPFGMSALALPMVALYFGAVGFAFLNDRRKARRQRNEYGEVDDDEASELSYTADPVDELEPVGAPEPIAASDLDEPSERVRRSRRFDDST